ncbi:MAG: hypothetical protein L0331_13925 [Chloroflexi bacterium]|nr:hypothetical protein [Chloroflexota bacterium]
MAIIWGTGFAPEAYDTLRYSQSLAAGRGPTYYAPAGIEVPPLRSPLFAGVVGLLALPGLPVDAVALVVSALGWGVLALVAWQLARGWGWPAGGALAAILLATTPLLLVTLGMETGWLLALGWLALSLALGREPAAWSGRRQAALALVLLAFLLAHYSLATLALVLLLAGWQVVRLRRLPLEAMVALGLATAGAGWLAGWQFSDLLILAPSALAVLAREWLQENELYWLLPAVAGLGTWAAWRAGRCDFALLAWWWAAMAALAGEPAVGVALALFLAGAGVEGLAAYLAAGRTQATPVQTLRVLLVAVGVPLLVLQGVSLVQRTVERPVTRWQLEEAAAAWLAANGRPEATIHAPARLGFLAGLPAFPSEAAGQGSAPEMLRALSQAPPDYFVALHSIAWDNLTRTGWFRERYAPVEQFASPYEAASPYTLWQYQSGLFDQGQQRPADVTSPIGVNIIGYQFYPERVEAGEALRVTLYLEATQPITRSFNTVVRIISELDEAAYAQRDLVTPRSLPVSWWQPGQVIAERFVLTTTNRISYGAYQVNVSLRPAEGGPFFPLFQGGDVNALDRINLGYVAVPWGGSVAAATPVGATFGDQITLDGYELSGEWTPGSTVGVALYWGALRPPDGDYQVFVHLLNEAGELVANHDGKPVDSRFKTVAWQPGDVIRDEHLLTLPADLPAGGYRLVVGLYLPETAERLAVQDSQGNAPSERALLVQRIEITP